MEARLIPEPSEKFTPMRGVVILIVSTGEGPDIIGDVESEITIGGG